MELGKKQAIALLPVITDDAIRHRSRTARRTRWCAVTARTARRADLPIRRGEVVIAFAQEGGANNITVGDMNQPTGIVAQPTPGMQPAAPPGPALPLGPPEPGCRTHRPGLPCRRTTGDTAGRAAGTGCTAGTAGDHATLAPPGPASPPGPPGIAPAAAARSAVPRLAHGVRRD